MKKVNNIIIKPNLEDFSNSVTFDEIERIYTNSDGETKNISTFEFFRKLFPYLNKEKDSSQDYISEGEPVNKLQLEKALESMKFQPVDPSKTIFSYFGIHGKKVVYLHKNNAMVFVQPELVMADNESSTHEGTPHFYNKIKLVV